MSRPVVSIVGRPNVGKSSIFNRLLGRRKALGQHTPGVTRDRNYALSTLDGRPVILCDTGGFEEGPAVADGRMAALIREQALVAIDESDVIVFVMDLRAGLTPTDEEIAQRLRAAAQPVVWVLNKCDHPKVEIEAADFYRLGVDRFLLVSAEHSVGLGDLVETIVDALPAEADALGKVPEPWVDRGRSRHRDDDSARGRGGRLQFLGEDMPEESTTHRGPAPQPWDPRTDPDATAVSDDVEFEPGGAFDEDGVEVRWVGGSFDDADQTVGWDEAEAPPDLPDFELGEDDDFVPRIALLGRPNVGKSTLLNRLLGYQRSITSPEAGTTHDTVDAFVEHDGRRYVLIDTAGIRRRRKVTERVEKLTVGRSIRTVEASHICLLLIDGTEGVTDQEAKLGALIADRGRALILLVNKWDLAGKGSGARKAFMQNLRRRMPHLQFADVLFISAMTGKGTQRIWTSIQGCNEGHRMTVRTAPLNRWARSAWAMNPPPMHKHRPVRLYYCSQTGVRPPSFVFFCNQPRSLPESWKRYLAAQLRAAFPAPGSPLRLSFKDRSGS